MAVYRCDSCKEYRTEPVCEKCGANTREVDPAEASLQQAAAGLRNAPIAVPPAPPREERRLPRQERKPDPAPRPPRPRLIEARPEPEPQPAPEPPRPRVETPPPAPAPEETTIHALDEFHALLDSGMKAIILCGGPNVGKSEIAAGFVRAKNVYRGDAQILTLRAPLRTDYVLGATTDEVWYQVIDGKRTFLDPSGEFFHRLSLEYRQKFGLPELTDNDFRFVKRAAEELAGLVLVFDLTKTVDARSASAWRSQEEEFLFILAALRWLRWDKEARPPNIRYAVNIAKQAKKLPLIDKPVVVLFSKADQLPKFSNKNPLQFARERLTTLHGAVMTHARRYRYDFCHTMIREGKDDRETDYPCGVLLPFEWMLDERFRWLPLQIPSRYLGGGK